jgi:hypothetical protein
MIQAHFWPANPVIFQNIYDSLKISMQIRFVYSLNSFDSLQIPRHLQVSALRLYRCWKLKKPTLFGQEMKLKYQVKYLGVILDSLSRN